MKQLIHSNGSNESNKRKLPFSSISEELCALLCQRQKTPTATFENGSPIRRGKTRVGRPNRAHTTHRSSAPPTFIGGEKTPLSGALVGPFFLSQRSLKALNALVTTTKMALKL